MYAERKKIGDGAVIVIVIVEVALGCHRSQNPCPMEIYDAFSRQVERPLLDFLGPVVVVVDAEGSGDVEAGGDDEEAGFGVGGHA